MMMMFGYWKSQFYRVPLVSHVWVLQEYGLYFGMQRFSYDKHIGCSVMPWIDAIN